MLDNPFEEIRHMADHETSAATLASATTEPTSAVHITAADVLTRFHTDGPGSLRDCRVTIDTDDGWLTGRLTQAAAVGEGGVVIHVNGHQDGTWLQDDQLVELVGCRHETPYGQRCPVCDVLARCQPIVYVNVYMHDRAYGGPEEGGWSYDTHDPVLSVPVARADVGDVERACRLQYEQTLNAGRRPVYSVLSEGRYVVEVEARPASAKPERRPRYE
jgi:hypothetical protein